MTKQEELQKQADKLTKAGASAQEFELLHQQGWKTPSHLEGSGLEPCPEDCGVCYPVPVLHRKRK